MRIIYSDKENGSIKKIEGEMFDIPFSNVSGPYLYIDDGDKCNQVSMHFTEGSYRGNLDGISFQMQYIENREHVIFEVQVKNENRNDFEPKDLGICIGIDTYMGEYPQRNHAFFPTMLRCENTHFHGYLMSPEGKICAIASPDAIASYALQYCKVEGEDESSEQYGHRIRSVALSFIHCLPLPERHPEGTQILRCGETKKYRIYLIPLKHLEEYHEKVAGIVKIPMIRAKQYTLPKNSTISYEVFTGENYITEYFSPDGKKIQKLLLEDYGVYTLKAKTESGKIAEAKFYCRKPWEWYLKKAREEAYEKPQKASTHTESWYGFFSAFLAAKHAPQQFLDKKMVEHFNEIMPLIFDLERIEPKVITERIQNTAAFISLLVDKYEMDPKHNQEDLKLAGNFADWLISRQREDGGYYRNNTLYTCVIYIAKSMLEVAEAEKRAGLEENALRHYQSAAKAIDQLVEKLDNIQTEGEQTFEDGMIICSALQIAMYALTLKAEQREKYVKAAKYMDKIHACLEQKLVPDCRMNGGSLRFWEAQYDILCFKNFVGSPHGWSAWTAYAKYYLYLLTGEESYLRELFCTLGSCVQLMSLDGKLRWAFANDPYVEAKKLVMDQEQPIKDGYVSVDLKSQAYRGKFEKVVFGETYLDMISGWYRTGKEKVTGGYLSCPLILPTGNVYVDNQGGACDNDVHEIFKCLEETVLKKAFVLERENGEICGYNCDAQKANGEIVIELYEETKWLHTNLKNPYKLQIGQKMIHRDAGMLLGSL